MCRGQGGPSIAREILGHTWPLEQERETEKDRNLEEARRRVAKREEDMHIDVGDHEEVSFSTPTPSETLDINEDPRNVPEEPAKEIDPVRLDVATAAMNGCMGQLPWDWSNLNLEKFSRNCVRIADSLLAELRK